MSGREVSADMQPWHPMWLPEAATAHLAGRTVRLGAAVPETVRREAAAAGLRIAGAGEPADLAIEMDASNGMSSADVSSSAPLGPESFTVAREGGTTTLVAGGPSGALYAWFHVVRLGARVFDDDAFDDAAFDEAAFDDAPPVRIDPAHELRMLDHWDNIDVHPVMGQVERGYAGGSIFFEPDPATGHGRVREDLSRVEAYARLLASIGINRVSINNVNVHAREARLITGDDLADLARVADVFRPWGIRLHASVSFAAPIRLGGLDTSDPLDPAVAAWWAGAVAEVYRAIPDFGGFVVKADSEGQPGPFAYGRDHADGANLLARALAPYGGLVHWRAFVYNHEQDWRDRSTDRARAAYDHFAPLDGRFDDNVIVQVKHGPMDFQVREPVSPVIPAMTRTRIALELQVTQEYTGHQKHAVSLAPMWREILDFAPFGDARSGGAGAGASVSDLVRGGLAAVSNVGDDIFWTGHPLAQANLYAYGRLAWDPTLDPAAILDEWIALTFGASVADTNPDAAALARGIHAILDDSWHVYEQYTAPLGVGFMVTPGSHYGPSIDGYEYSPWGTYHFADRDGVGVDRTVATGTGYAGQYPSPWRERYESLETVPDELVLFFHHVPYGHVLHSGSTVIQHIYDTHFDGAAAVDAKLATWTALEGRVPADVFARVTERLAEQQRSAREWRDQVTTYFFRKSGVPDASGRVIP